MRLSGAVLCVSAMVIGIFAFPSAVDLAAELTGRGVERTIRVVSVAGDPGSQVIVPVEIDSGGNEVGLQFTLIFNPAVLSISNISTGDPGGPNPDVMLGSGAPPGTALTINATQAPTGRIGILVDSNNAFQASPPARQIATFRFTINPGAPAGMT
ncbi:MAG: cohesin domain-containing protein, partial [Pyrinomonadaceae bacterium]